MNRHFRQNLPAHRTFDLDEFTGLCNSIRAASEPIVNRVREKPDLMRDFVVLRAVYFPSLFFIFVAVLGCGVSVELVLAALF